MHKDFFPERVENKTEKGTIGKKIYPNPVLEQAD